MTQWPQTCLYCGAPTQSGACPRCRYRERKPAPVVFTAPAPFPEDNAPPDLNVYFPLGTNQGRNTNQVTIPGVTLSQGSTLIVGAMDTNSVLDPPVTITCTWNGAVPQRVLHFPGNFGPRAVLFERNNVTAGTDDVTVTWTGDPVIGQLNVFATELKLGPAPDNATGVSDGNDDHPTGDIAGTPSQPFEIFVGALATFGTQADLDTATPENCLVGQAQTQSGSSIIELYRIDSSVQSDTHLALTDYNPGIGRPWSMIVADLKIG